jgi:chorismate--pyruvate lyase
VTPIPRDTSWQPSPAAAGAYRPWLTDRGSLTARIAERCPGVRVQVLFQGLRRADRDERFVFADRGRSRVLVREVFLVCRDVPVVFAHTVLDATNLRGAWRGIATLGSKPLGAALFADPRVERFALRSRKLGWHHELHRRVQCYAPPAWTNGVHGSLWARRSLFRLHNSPILVTEVFLPAILRL